MDYIRIGGLFVALSVTAFSQQFQWVPNAIPGPSQQWTEGVECADVDHDGDLDFFLANGGGWSTNSVIQYQNQLILNQGGLVFTDASVARLGVHASGSKKVITGDIQGDGYEDALFLNCFDGNPPSLYVNRGTTQPGYFDFQGVARGFGEVLSSYSGQFGDVDDDGDLDVVISDSTTFWDQLLDGVSPQIGHPRLYLNDGAGYFGEVTGPAWNPLDRIGAHDVQLVDIDNDFDVDVLVSNVTTGAIKHFLLLNDGNAHFSDVSQIIPAAGKNVWETEVADLDGDTDADLFVLGVKDGASPTFWLAAHGPLENQTVGGSGLGFASQATNGASDINEIVLLDYDVDGNLDAFIGTLGIPANQVHRNLGGLQFQIASGLIAPGLDPQNPTLDATAADLDGDGDYDYLTVQGEYANTNWTNTLFQNLGSADTLAPVVLRLESLFDGADRHGPWHVRAAVRDQVVDDGKDWIAASATYSITTTRGQVISASAKGISVASGMKRIAMPDAAAGAGKLLTYQLHFIDAAGNETTTPPQSITLCGADPFGSASGANTIVLQSTGSAVPGGTLVENASNVPGNLAFVMLSLGAANLSGLGGTIYVDPTKFIGPILSVQVVSGIASLALPLPASNSLTGATVEFQWAAPDPTKPAGYALSNGLEVTFCPCSACGP